MKKYKIWIKILLILCVSLLLNTSAQGQARAYNYCSGDLEGGTPASSEEGYFIVGISFYGTLSAVGTEMDGAITNAFICGSNCTFQRLQRGVVTANNKIEHFVYYKIFLPDNFTTPTNNRPNGSFAFKLSNGTIFNFTLRVFLVQNYGLAGEIELKGDDLKGVYPSNLVHSGFIDMSLAERNNMPYVVSAVRWEKQVLGESNWTVVPNQNDSEYNRFEVPVETCLYRRVITRNGIDYPSNIITAHYIRGGEIAIEKESVGSGETINISSITAATSGYGDPVRYIWEEKEGNSSSWNRILDKNSPVYTVPNLTKTTTFRRQAIFRNGEAFSNEVTVTVSGVAVKGGEITANNTTIENGGSVTFTSTEASEGTGITYRWEKKTTGSWGIISGATSKTYSASNLTTTNSFRRVTVKDGTDYISNEITITVEAPVTGGTITSNTTTVENGGNVILGSSSVSEGTGITYHWEKRTAGSWNVISGATSQTYSASNLTENTTFRRVTTKNGTNYNSNEVTITVTIPPIVTPIPTPTSTKDYVMTTTYISSSAINKVYDITYTDGFGRPLQDISIGATATGKDIVKVHQYGLFGRTEKEFLPYNATTNTGAFQAATNFGIYGADASYAFNKIEYDNSPLDRVVKQTGAGSAWHTADKGVSMSYSLNSASDVILWTVSDAGVLTNSGYYGTGTLSKITMTNEDGAVSYEYKDNQDRVLLSTAMNGTDALKTYYVYDDFGLLRFVLTPEAVKQGATSTINTLSYTYKYDHRHLLIEKKLPGADPIFYKYDAKDRLVLSQDGNQRQRGVWSYTLYDSKNRSIEIGETSSTPPSTIGDSYDPTTKSALQYLYYDNYNYAGVQSFNITENISGIDKYDHVTGLQTGAKTKVLGTDSWIITTTYFDNKVRPIQVIADIYGVTGGKSIVSTKYDFVGNVLQTREKHENDVVVSTNTYDTRGRLLTTSTSLNGSTPATMAYVYDELGRLSTKKYGNNTVSETYAYNVRGWLTEKNSSKFNMKLRYQNPAISGTTALYNGNITEWEWKQGANTAQTYSFTYDGISRLTDNKQYTQGGSNWTLNNSFVEQGLTYDFNGNIKSLQRYSNGSLKDNFSYNYTGNQLLSLNSVSGNYLYDKNGNMTKDPRKNLDIEYNSLNLLSEVKQGGARKAKYIYAADGTKLGVVDAGGNGYDYRGSLIYKSTSGVKSLESVAFSDGRIIKSTSNYTSNYNITDHLGSVRVVFDGSGNIVETNDYYAFGGRHANGSSTISNNRFKFNGKEDQTTGNLGFLDYGSRMNDPELGRWFVLDPKAEKYYELSGYNYCVNNPVVYIDPNGEDVWTTSNPNQISDFLSSMKSGNEKKNLWNWDYASDREFLFGHSLFGREQSPNYLTSLIANLRKNGLNQLDWRSVMNNGNAIATQVLKGILYQNLDGVKNRGIVDMKDLFAGYPTYHNSGYTDRVASFNDLIIKGFGTPFAIKYFEIASSRITKFDTNPIVKNIDNFNPNIIDRGYTFRVVGDGNSSLPLVYLRVNVNNGSEDKLKKIIYN